MTERVFENPVTGERAILVESSRESGGARTIMDLEVRAGGGPPGHSHDRHEERLDVLEGVLEVTVDGTTRRLTAGEHVVIPRGSMHAWRNASGQMLRFRGMHTPGNPGFEVALRVLFGLARDGEVRAGGIPRRLGDLALIAEWNQGMLSGPARLIAPLMAWCARRARARGRAAELLRRYGCEDPINAR